jgi:hypothetical protein
MINVKDRKVYIPLEKNILSPAIWFLTSYFFLIKHSSQSITPPTSHVINIFDLWLPYTHFNPIA